MFRIRKDGDRLNTVQVGEAASSAVGYTSGFRARSCATEEKHSIALLSSALHCSALFSSALHCVRAEGGVGEVVSGCIC